MVALHARHSTPQRANHFVQNRPRARRSVDRV